MISIKQELDAISPEMFNRTKNIPAFESYTDRQEPDEGMSSQQQKRGDNNIDEDNRLNVNYVKNY